MIDPYSQACSPVQRLSFWVSERGQFLRGLYDAVLRGVQKEAQARKGRFDYDVIDERTAGNERWNHVENEVAKYAEIHGWQAIWQPTGYSGHPRMLVLRKGLIVLTVHQISSSRYGDSVSEAKYRDLLHPIPSPEDFLLITPEQEAELELYRAAQQAMSGEIGEYWQLTYPREDGDLKWLGLGIPERMKRGWKFQVDMIQLFDLKIPRVDLNEGNIPDGFDFGDEDESTGTERE